jgi:hypothetical protein
LYIVRNPEELPVDLRVIEAYIEQLLEDEEGKEIPIAYFRKSRFKDDNDRRWEQATFQRDRNGYVISVYADDIIGKPLSRMTMRPFRDVYAVGTRPAGVDGVIRATGAAGQVHESNDPAKFRDWLETIWGPLPPGIQRKLGISQTENRTDG